MSDSSNLRRRINTNKDAQKDEKTLRDKIRRKHHSVRSTAVRNVAVWRFLFFCIMTFYEYGNPQVLTPFGSLDLQIDIKEAKTGKDRWFVYQQFQWLQDLHHDLGKHPQRAMYLNHSGYLLGALSAISIELGIPGWKYYASGFTAIYCMQFFVKATSFTNHNYLFPLLMILTILSGGGHISGKPRPASTIRSCEAAVIAFRIEFALLYGFASLWKLHEDWFNGSIVGGIFKSFEESNKARGIPWKSIEEQVPWVFVGLALSGLILDSSMFAVLTFVKPTPASRNFFLAFTLMFHVFTGITMAQLIGYSFPGTCIVGLAIFLPVGRSVGKESIYYDHSLIEWIYILCTAGEDDDDVDDYGHKKNDNEPSEAEADHELQYEPPTPFLRKIVLYWGLWQLLMPLRMPIVSSGNFPMNRLGYRYSWTMMLHSLEHGIIRQNSDGIPTVLLLEYLVPTCFSNNSDQGDVVMPREVYFGEQSLHQMQDHRTVPLHMVLGARESAMFEVFPAHLVQHIAAGFAKVIDVAVGSYACKQHVPDYNKGRIGMHAVSFVRLNGRGPFSRLVDPTVDIINSYDAQQAQPFYLTAINALLDRRPDGFEFVLKGVGSLRQRAMIEEHNLKEMYPGVEISMIADRAACLQYREIWLRPMLKQYTLIPIILPTGVSVHVRMAQMQSEGQVEAVDHYIELGDRPLPILTIAAEVGLGGMKVSGSCIGTTAEDVLIALIHA